MCAWEKQHNTKVLNFKNTTILKSEVKCKIRASEYNLSAAQECTLLIFI